MNISLDSDMQRFVEEKLKSGQYASADELVRDALRQLREQQQLTADDIAELRQLVDVGIAQADRGEFVRFSAGSIIEEGNAILAKEKRME